MIYTSYYSNQNINDNYIKVGISLTSPYKVHTIKQLYPSWELLNSYKSNMDEEEYIRRYNKEVLDKLNPLDIIGQIRRISMSNGGKKIVLLCYESPNKFCHRHLVAKWLSKNGYRVEELNNNRK